MLKGPVFLVQTVSAAINLIVYTKQFETVEMPDGDGQFVSRNLISLELNSMAGEISVQNDKYS